MKPIALRRAEQGVLQHLKRLAYATQSQLEYWAEYSQPTMSLALSALRDMRFVGCEKGVTPNVWYLSRKGSRVFDAPLPSGNRKSSWSVMAHIVHRNQCEILLRAKHPQFRFLDKTALYPWGLNPSHGEHAGFSDGKVLFVLLDDYLMGSDRISTTISRRHSVNEKYCDLKVSVNWRMISSLFFVASTNKAQLKNHSRWMLRKGLKAQLLYIPPHLGFLSKESYETHHHVYFVRLSIRRFHCDHLF